jgi:gliding motility-associated-like protein
MYAASVDDPFEVWVEITFASAPQFNIGPDSTFLCFGDTVWLISDYNATPGANYSIIWQNNSISDSFAVVTSGSYIATLIVEGLVACPATDSVLVTEGAGSSFQEVIQLCEGETFYFNGHEFYADTTICAVYPNQQGCDSSHCTVLTFLPQVQISLDTAICAGDSIFLGGQYFYNPGTYQTILHNNNGCDTVLQLQLMVIQPQYNNIDTIVCEGENVVIGNQVFSDEGTFLVTLTSYLGCDSLVELNLQTVQPAIGTIYEVICQGDSIEIGGSVYYQSGSYEFHLPNWLGCDSTVILNLMVDPIVQIEIDTAICQGSAVVWDGQTLSGAGVYSYLTQSTSGCDTLKLLNLTVLDSPQVNVQVLPGLCNSSAIIYVDGGQGYLFAWSNGKNSDSILIDESGTYQVTVKNTEGCTSVVYADIALAEPISVSLSYQGPTCAELEDGWLSVDAVSGGLPPYEIFINGNNTGLPSILEELSGGLFDVQVIDSGGCEWDSAFSLVSPPNFLIDASPDLSILKGQSIELQVVSSQVLDSVWWQPQDYLNCPTCSTVISTPAESTAYSVTAINEHGCISMDSMYIEVENNVKGIYAPNVFSPNGDGINDHFILFADESVGFIETLKIFDRWGGLVFEKNTLAPGNLSDGWNGTAHGKPCNQGIYIWLAVLELLDGTQISLSGEVTIIQ